MEQLSPKWGSEEGKGRVNSVLLCREQLALYSLLGEVWLVNARPLKSRFCPWWSSGPSAVLFLSPHRNQKKGWSWTPCCLKLPWFPALGDLNHEETTLFILAYPHPGFVLWSQCNDENFFGHDVMMLKDWGWGWSSAYLTSLHKNVSSGSYEVSSIKTRLKLSCDKFALSRQLVPIFHTANGVILVYGDRTHGSHIQTYCSNFLGKKSRLSVVAETDRELSWSWWLERSGFKYLSSHIILLEKLMFL